MRSRLAEWTRGTAAGAPRERPAGGATGPPATAEGPRRARRFWPWVAALLLGCVALCGRPVPAYNEEIYLLSFYQAWHPGFLATDWTFSQPWYQHEVFNLSFGWMTWLLPLVAVGWIGRIVCWTFVLFGLFRLAGPYGIPAWWTAASILLWLAYDQSNVAREWMIGGFEAKSVAYGFLLAGIAALRPGVERGGSGDAAAARAESVAAVLLGLCFSFHSGVGLWGAGAVVLSLPSLGLPPRRIARFGLLALAGALPGLATAGLIVQRSAAFPAHDFEFYVRAQAPYHLDPYAWSPGSIAKLYAFAAFNLCHALWPRRGPGDLRFLGWYQVWLCAFFTAGLALRVAGVYEPLKYMPFRLCAVFTPLLFLFHAGRFLLAYTKRRAVGRAGSLRAESVRWAALGFLTVFAAVLFRSPAARAEQAVRFNLGEWRKAPDGAARAFRWLAENTPEGATAILPPWRKDSYYLTRRAQVACWFAPRVDRLPEWRERVEALIGKVDTEDLPPGRTPYVLVTRMQAHYEGLAAEQIDSLARLYGCRYLVSRKDYDYPKLHDTGTYAVYGLPGTDGQGEAR